MTAIVRRYESPSCKLIRVGRYLTHSHGDYDYFRAECDACGWKSQSYPNRQVEYHRLAERAATQHRCPPATADPDGDATCNCSNPYCQV